MRTSMDAMNTVIDQIKDECKVQGVPICTWTEDGEDETDRIWKYSEKFGHSFIGKTYIWNIESISKSGKTIKGKYFDPAVGFSSLTEFSKISIKKLIQDCVNTRT